MIVRTIFFVWAILVGAVLLLSSCTSSEPRGPVVFAASSLQRPLEELAAQWAGQGRDPPVLSFASSTALARQIDNGSPADLFISADQQWTDYVVRIGRLPEDAIRPLAGNRIVVAAHVDYPYTDFSGESATIATGDPEAVPLGRYAKEALTSARLWDGVANKLLRTPSSSAALRLVLLREADTGVLYASDVASRDDLKILLAFPPDAHSPIIYKALKLPSSAHPDTQDFLDFLSSDDAQAVFGNYGFSRP